MIRSVGRAALVAALFLFLSCAGTPAPTTPAPTPPAPATGSRPAVVPAGPPQWKHDWARGAVFYEIFVRSFSDSNGDGIGDFNGLTAKLDYLNDGDPRTTTDLGVEGIWLMPVFESNSDHGYDTIDYETIEKDYGTSADFERFLAEAHKRGIRVILDLVMNHTSVEHPWFVEAASSPSSPKRDWYVWSSVNPGWKQPWGGNDPSWHSRGGAFYYGAFSSGMPDLNFRNPAVKEEMFRIARHWLARGVDGFRLDATRYLVETGSGEEGQADTAETHQVLREMSEEVRRVRPEAVLVAENTVDTAKLAKYFGSTREVAGGDEMPMNFNFPLAAAVVEGMKNGTATRTNKVLADMVEMYPKGIIDAPFLTNHDQTRVATVVDNHPGKLRNAAAILLTLPGAPFLYYGEEIGLQNGPAATDESKRTPMPWSASGGFTTAAQPWHPYAPGLATANVASQTGEANSLLSYYRGWIAARKRSPALSKGWVNPVPTSVRNVVYVRHSEEEVALVVHNIGDTALTIALPVATTALTPIHLDPGVGVPNTDLGAWTVHVPAYSSAVWRVH